MSLECISYSGMVHAHSCKLYFLTRKQLTKQCEQKWFKWFEIMLKDGSYDACYTPRASTTEGEL